MSNKSNKSSGIDIATKAQQLFKMHEGDLEADENFYQVLIDEFSNEIDVMQQLKLFHAWCLDQHPTKIKNPRFRFRSWLTNASEYSIRRKTRTTPAAFIKTKKQLEQDLTSLEY